MKKPAFFITCLVFVILALSIIQVIVSNRLSTTGITLSNLEEETMYYDRQNSLLREKLLTVSSLTHIASTAGQLGFIENKSQIILTTSLPLAVRQ